MFPAQHFHVYARHEKIFSFIQAERFEYHTSIEHPAFTGSNSDYETLFLERNAVSDGTLLPAGFVLRHRGTCIAATLSIDLNRKSYGHFLQSSRLQKVSEA